jgi:DNA-binding NarL/FixJ family response regulator
MSERKAVIKNADMTEELQQDAIDCATQVLNTANVLRFVQTLFQACCPIYYQSDHFSINKLHQAISSIQISPDICADKFGISEFLHSLC